jgi:disulfide bond formation protein DsbB
MGGVLGGSLGLLSAAIIAGWILRVPPCSLCMAQRGVYAALAVVAGLALWNRRFCPGTCSLLCGTGALLALAQSGLERAWWDAPFLCATRFAAEAPLTLEHMQKLLGSSGGVDCRQVWIRIAGFSLAEWNGLVMAAGTVMLAWAAWSARKKP